MSDQDRTEAEREAARRNREARRRQREGDAPAGGPDVPARRIPVPRAVTDRSSDGRAKRAGAPLAAPRSASPATSDFAREPGPLTLTGTPEPAGTPPPRGPRPPRTGPRPARAPRRGPDRERSSLRTRLAAAFVLVLGVVVIVVAWFLISLYQPFTGSGRGRVQVTIPRDSSTGEVATLLHRDGVIGSSFFFKLRAELASAHFSAGNYDLAHAMSYGAALSSLAKGPTAPPTENVTIIPGKSRFQLDQLLRSQGVPGSYLADTRQSNLLDPAVYGAPRNTPSLEGFLYPDTYQLRKPLSIPALVADQLGEFKTEMSGVNLAYARSRHLSAYDVLIIASLEDAEAAAPADLPKVASVIYNRLALGMTLGLDTTAAYAANNYTGNLTTAQLNSASPWNTTNHKGLPPTPIDSPDITAIEAAANPAHTDDLYFIVKVCGDGRLNFTNSYNQFLAWSQQYSQSLAAKGANKTEFCSGRG